MIVIRRKWHLIQKKKNNWRDCGGIFLADEDLLWFKKNSNRTEEIRERSRKGLWPHPRDPIKAT